MVNMEYKNSNKYYKSNTHVSAVTIQYWWCPQAQVQKNLSEGVQLWQRFCFAFCLIDEGERWYKYH